MITNNAAAAVLLLQGGRPQTLHYAVTVAGKLLEMQLEKNK